VSPLNRKASEDCLTPTSHLALSAVSSISNIAHVLAGGPRSPPLTAHPSSFQSTWYSDKPLPGRPRSHTTPSAPLPSPALAELPGSFPIESSDDYSKYPHSAKIPVQEAARTLSKNGLNKPREQSGTRLRHTRTNSQEGAKDGSKDDVISFRGPNLFPSPVTPPTPRMDSRPTTGRRSTNESSKQHLTLSYDVSPLPSPQISQQPMRRQQSYLGILTNEVSASSLPTIHLHDCSFVFEAA